MSSNGRPTATLLAMALVCLLATTASKAAIEEGYQRPPQALADIVEAPPTPEVQLSPDRQWLLLTETPSLVELTDLAEEELRIAGMRIRPATNGRSRERPIKKLTLMDRATLTQRAVTGLPAGARIDNLRWSPDSKTVAFTTTDETNIVPWVLDAATAKARRLADLRLNAVAGDPLRWLPDSKALIVATVPAGRPAPPTASRVPTTPVIQENAGKEAPARTYQDLLKSPHDSALFEYYSTAQLIRVNVAEGKTKKLGAPCMLWDFDPSPDGSYVQVELLHRPFSYLVPASRFPRSIEIWNTAGEKVKVVAELPLQEQVPIAFDSVPTGARSAGWRDDKPATLTWVEARDGGDSRAEAEIRDEILSVAAPFEGKPTSVARLELRYAGIAWGNDDTALVSERWWKNRRTRTWRIAPGTPTRAPELLVDRSYQDRYSDPGRPVTTPTPAGGEVLLIADGAIYLIGEGASPEGNRPFFDRLDLQTKETKRLWQSEAPYYERPVLPLDIAAGVLLTRRESQEDPPNYFTRSLADGALRQLTAFPHPTPQLVGLHKELLQYDREDGVRLTATLYLPPGYTRGRDARLPILLWAYPTEFKSADDAGQVKDSPHQFDRIGWWSPLIFLARGYAVLDDPTMPIIGEGDVEPNDTYVTQLVASAAAAIDTVVDMGVADRKRVAIGGHSYGAFMTANLLAHSDLFAAGIARSGAYNRTLTPFGFQSEERTLWQDPEIYFAMSPFMHAEKINEPLLLVHGDADNNSGTFPLQSERFYHALKGLGATARLVMLPEESHGYRARESVLHMMWEMDRWLEVHVRQPGVERAGVGAAAGSE